MMHRVLALLLVVGWTQATLASPPDRSLIPKPRVANVETAQTPRVVSVRPVSVAALRPKPRPKGLMQRDQTVKASSRRGSVCGVDAIKGQIIAPIAGPIKGCGVADPVRITSVSGVALSTPATVDCTTAKALNTWVKSSAIPTVGRKGGGVVSLRIVAHYACRTRNNQPGGRISEHGRGRAVDISAIGLKDGSQLRVLGGWRDRTQGPLLKKMHKGACGPFGTVLGPESNRFHQDHFHFDTARYRSGSYCR